MKKQYIRQAHLPQGAYNKSFTQTVTHYMKPKEGKLNWHALRFNVCPLCGNDFVFGLTTTPISGDKLFSHDCGFKIRESKYNSIVIKQTQDAMSERELEKEEDLL